MDASIREFVRRRSGNRCEYCHIPQEATPFIPFHVEHIIAKQHVDWRRDEPGTLAYSCDRCNAFKKKLLSSIDPVSGQRVDVFNPRLDQWSDHFKLAGGEILGLTPMGRATVRLLNMNNPRRVELRLKWLDEGGSW